MSVDIEGYVMQQTDHFSGGSNMVRARIYHGGRTVLVHVADAMNIRYQDKIMQHHIILHMKVNGAMFQHNDARPHDCTC